MKVAIIGGTGLIGSRLVKELALKDHEPIILSRRADSLQKTPTAFPVRKWNPGDAATNRRALESVDAIVNLAGEPIDSGRWTPARKKNIRDSRLQSAKSIVDALAGMDSKPRLLVSGSAVGFYGSRADDVLTESEDPGGDFLAMVCRDTEREANNAQDHGLRVVNIRTGVVLSASGGALGKMITPFKFGLGGRIGDGKQWFPWIHEEDIAGIIIHCLESESVSGPINATAPGIVTNGDFSSALGNVLGKPAVFPVPLFLLKMLFGEMSRVMYASHRTSCAKIQQSGYSFVRGELTNALRDCV